MTTIVAVKAKNKVILGHDSQATMPWGGKFNLRDGKVVRNGSYTFGVSGIADMMHALEDAELPSPTGDLTKFVRNDLCSFLSALEKDMFGDFVSSLIIVVHGEIFTYRAGRIDFANIQNVHSAGSGGEYAENYLLSLNKQYRPSDVRRALEFAASRDSYTSGPFSVHEIR